MKEIMEILNNLDWSPLFISIKTGIVATIISFFLGVYAARKVIKAKPWVKAVADEQRRNYYWRKCRKRRKFREWNRRRWRKCRICDHRKGREHRNDN